MTSLKYATISINNNIKNYKENCRVVDFIYDNLTILNNRGIKFDFTKKRIKTFVVMTIENEKYEGSSEIISVLSTIINKKQKEEKRENMVNDNEFSMEKYMERNATTQIEEDDDKADQRRKDRAAEIAKHREISKPKKEEKKEQIDQHKTVKTSYDDLKDNLTKSNSSVSFSDNPEIVSFLKNKTKNMTTEDINDYNLLKSMGESNSGLFN